MNKKKFFFEAYDSILTPTAAALPWPVSDPYPQWIDGQKVGPGRTRHSPALSTFQAAQESAFRPIPRRTVCRSAFSWSLRQAGTVFCALWRLSSNRHILGSNSLPCCSNPFRPTIELVFRIGHLGDLNDLMLCGVEMGLGVAGGCRRRFRSLHEPCSAR